MAEITVFYEGSVVTRAEARDKGLRRYFTGIPCLYGHIAERAVSQSGCIRCRQLRYLRDKDYENQRSRAWRKNNREWFRRYDREYRATHLEEERAVDRKRYADGRKKKVSPLYLAQWERANRPKRRKRHHERQATDPQYRLRRALRARLKQAIKKHFKTGSAVRLLGCSIDALKHHLEAHWLPGMTWNNFGRLHASDTHWQIDHKQPLSSFDLTDPTQVAIACHWTNLQPLWALDNRRKWKKTS